MTIVVVNARSGQLCLTAQLLACDWVLGTQAWLLFKGDTLTVILIIFNVILASFFLRMARRSWFAVPLLILHITYVLYGSYTLVFDVEQVWARGTLNRAYDCEFLYIACCGLYRIYALRQRANSTPAH